MLKQFTKAKLPADNKTCHQNFRTQYQPHFSLQVGAATDACYQKDFLNNRIPQKSLQFSNSIEVTYGDLLTRYYYTKLQMTVSNF